MSVAAELLSVSLCRVLIVEDVGAVRSDIRTALDSRSVEFEECETRDDFYERLRGDAPDVVMLDLGFPDGTWDIVRISEEIRRAWPHTMVVVLTETSVEPADQKAADGFIRKSRFYEDRSVLSTEVLRAMTDRAGHGGASNSLLSQLRRDWARAPREGRAGSKRRGSKAVARTTKCLFEDGLTCGAVSLPLCGPLLWEAEGGGRVLRVGSQVFIESDADWMPSFIRLFLMLEQKAARDGLSETEETEWLRLCELVDVEKYNRKFLQLPRLVGQLKDNGSGSVVVHFAGAGEAALTENARRDVEIVRLGEWFEADVIYAETDGLVARFANIHWPILLPEVTDDEVSRLFGRS